MGYACVIASLPTSSTTFSFTIKDCIFQNVLTTSTVYKINNKSIYYVCLYMYIISWVINRPLSEPHAAQDQDLFTTTHAQSFTNGTNICSLNGMKNIYITSSRALVPKHWSADHQWSVEAEIWSANDFNFMAGDGEAKFLFDYHNYFLLYLHA